MASKGAFSTTPLDSRFPNTNQAQHCWTRYNEYVLCLKKTDGDDEGCSKYLQFASSICPSAWMDNWEEQREAGTFPGVQYPARE